MGQEDAHRSDCSTPSREGPCKPPRWVLTKSPARMGSRGAGGERAEARCTAWRVLGDARGATRSAATGGKQGAHGTAKDAALSQIIIFMRQQHLSLSTQQQISWKAAHGGGASPAPCCGTAASRGAPREV